MNKSYISKPTSVVAYQWFKDIGSEDVELLDKAVVYAEFTLLGMLKTGNEDELDYVCDRDYIITFADGKKEVMSESRFLDSYLLSEGDLIPHGNC